MPRLRKGPKDLPLAAIMIFLGAIAVIYCVLDITGVIRDKVVPYGKPPGVEYRKPW